MSATENQSIAFRQFHEADGGRIRYQKVCELDGQVVHQGEIGRGYEISRDTIIAVTDAELDAMPLPTAKAIEIVAFVPAETIDPVLIGDSYYLAADGAVAAKPYVLLRQALERSSKVAVAKYTWHNRERLGLLRIKEDAIVLHSLKWPDEIRSSESLVPKPVPVNDEEIQAAVDLMEAMAVEDLSGFRDHYREALEDLTAPRPRVRSPTGLSRSRPQPPSSTSCPHCSNPWSPHAKPAARTRPTRPAMRRASTTWPGHAPAKKTAKAPGKKSAAKKTAGRKSSA
ncbi:non-homologous end joining protein Ku [Streptomyces sp. NPDC054887]